MKKSIIIFGSTGSIGSSTVSVILKNITKFNIVLLTAKKNHKKLLKQAKLLNAQYIYIKDQSKIDFLKHKTKNMNIKVIKDLSLFIRTITKKIDYVISGISGLDGLECNLKIIKYTKKILVANKESIICGWNLLEKKLRIFKTELIPLDSEHFSIYSILKNIDISKIKNIIITASGGPFYNKKYIPRNVSIEEVCKHPKWKMGKKISTDSATLINKVFEVIEACRLFNLPKEKIKIIIHPESYIHAIINMNDGMNFSVMHNTDMKIPILSAFGISNLLVNKYLLNFNIKKLNKLTFHKVNNNKFTSVKLLKFIPNKATLFDTVFITANDTLVELFLKRKILFPDILLNLKKIIKLKEFSKYRKISPNKFIDIIKVRNYVRLKTNLLSVRSG